MNTTVMRKEGKMFKVFWILILNLNLVGISIVHLLINLFFQTGLNRYMIFWIKTIEEEQKGAPNA
jgi:hypothetical protein